jgi:hypothetical protein
MKKILFLLIMVGAWKFYHYESQVSLGPGVMVREQPQQEKIISPLSHRLNAYTINEVATFNIKAKVLSKENYYSDRGSDISPIDLALGWGNMSDESVLAKIEITQSRRFYYWRLESFPIPRKEIESHSANMHIIPASDSVKSTIKKIRKGDIVEMSGSLVNAISNDDNWTWRSSQTRNDTGNGACELFWVENIRIITP